MSKDSVQFYQENQDEAWLDLSIELSKQSLCLMVGAGASAGFGLPGWPALVTRVADAVSDKLGLKGADRFPISDLSSGGVSTDTLLRRVLRVRKRLNDDHSFDEVVADCLYHDLGRKDPSLINTSATLRALGLMVSGSKRGRITEIVSYNFDGIFEWYLMQHGFVVASYRNWPSEYIDADVRIYHPHGYAPFPWTHRFGVASEFLAFDEETVNRIVIDPTNNWKHLYRYLFCTRKIFAVGLSGKDPIVNMMLQEASLVRGKAGPDEPPMGYWCQRSPQGKPEDEYTLEEWKDWKASLNNSGIVLLEYPSHEDLGEKLVKVVQHAAGDMLQGG